MERWQAILFAVILSGCATPKQDAPIQTTPVIDNPIPVEVVPTNVPTINADQIQQMMNQAERCGGNVKFQAEIENDKTRARFTCEWTETEESQEWW